MPHRSSMPHSVLPFGSATKQSSSSVDMSLSNNLSGTVTKKRSSSANIICSVLSGRVTKSSSSAHQVTTTNGVRVEEWARAYFSAEGNDGRQSDKAQDVIMNDASSDEAKLDMTLENAWNSQRLWQVPPGAASEFDPDLESSWQEYLSKNLEGSKIELFPQHSRTCTPGTYRKPLPPPAFPFSREEGWCLRRNRKSYRERRFNEPPSKEKDPVDRLIHSYSEQSPKNCKRPKREFSLYHQKLGLILTMAEYLYDSYGLCKERAKALQHEPVNSSHLRECIDSADQWKVAEDIDTYFDQWLTRYNEIFQPEEMDWEGMDLSVSNSGKQSMNWESVVPPSLSFGQHSSMNWVSVRHLVPPVRSPGTSENGNAGRFECILRDLVIPSLAVSESSTA